MPRHHPKKPPAPQPLDPRGLRWQGLQLLCADLSETLDIHAMARRDEKFEYLLELGPHTFRPIWLRAADTARLGFAIAESTGMRSRRPTPLIIVPYMGTVGQRLCRKAGINWVDRSGNAHITLPNFIVRCEGRPNQFRQRGRPANVFAPKSARITRWLLITGGGLTRRQLAHQAQLSEPMTSKVTQALLELRLIQEDEFGRLRPTDPDALLDAWRERYRFAHHHVIQGHIAARSGEDLQQRIAKTLTAHKLAYAMTGLGAAWLFSKFAGFRLNTIYLKQPLPVEVLSELGFRDEPRGANVWWVVPDDDGVFHGAELVVNPLGINCVHPIQVFLDLSAHPERATEAAEHLRSKLIARYLREYPRHA